MITTNDDSEFTDRRPYAMVGAGELTASIWKLAVPSLNGQYRFSIFHMSRDTGRVSQQFNPCDVAALVKLSHVLAATLLDDGCLSDVDRRGLRKLLSALETLLSSEETEATECREENRVHTTVIS
jgi:hypothetical protein